MKVQTKLNLYYYKYCFEYKFLRFKNKYKRSDKKRVWIFLGADYGNLGDVAITLFQEEFLERKFRDSEIVTIPISQTLAAIPQVKRIIDPNDIVTIVGGGNISDLYDDIEFLRQRVIKAFPHNQMISFPQSIHLTETENGEKERQRIAKIYGAHRRMLILMRDSVSFQRMKQILPDANVKIAPDIVMSADCRSNTRRKKQLLLCLRNDKEAADKCIGFLKPFIQNMQQQGYVIVQQDTQIDNQLIKEDGGKVHVQRFLKEVSASSLIVTDRLHGMIFAFITGTPAIVLDNSTGKVFATYEWIKDCGYIHFVNKGQTIPRIEIKDNFEQISADLNKILDNAINMY